MLPDHPLFIDRTGLLYGSKRVIEIAGKKGTRYLWRCTCETCGASRVYDTGNLTKCGPCNCRPKKIPGDCAGLSQHPLYGVWREMIRRCYTAGRDRSKYYHDKGIRVCERWLYLPNFIADMGPRPPGYTIDRIDSDKDYAPGNCRWATFGEQRWNQKTRKRHTTGYRRALELIHKHPEATPAILRLTSAVL